MKKLTRTQTDELILQYKNLGSQAKKGIALVGNPGMGKTHRLQQIHPDFIACYDIALASKIGKLESYIQKLKSELNFSLDEIGSEGLYNAELMTQFIYVRYSLWKKNPLFKFNFTTNLNPTQLQERYPGAWSRIQEMCTIIHLEDSCIREELTEDCL
jgi:DNA replication protein DnaC